MAGGSKPKNAEVVYFVRGMSSNLIKIGVARNVFRRLGALQTGSPDRLSVMGIMRPDDPCGMESRLHNLFRDERSHGEWFQPSRRLLDYIHAHAVSAHLDQDYSAWAIVLSFHYRSDPEGFWNPRPAPRRVRAKKPPVARAVMKPVRPAGLGHGKTMKERLRAYKEARGIPT